MKPTPTKHHIRNLVRNALSLIVIAATLWGCGSSRATATPEETPATAKRLTILFGGDIMQHMPQITAAKRDSTYDYTETFRYIEPLFDSADLVMLNFESTVSANGKYSGYPMFSAPEELVTTLKNAGADILMLANNHICDKGMAGIRATNEAIEQAGLEYTGAFADSARHADRNPLFVEAKGIRLGILNYTYGTNGMPVPAGAVVNLIDTARIAQDLRLIEERGADHTIVFFHWGYEYTPKPSESQKRLAQWCHDRGVELVIGSHPHVLQPAYILRDSSGRGEGITAYSLGNLVSNQRKRRTDGGMLLKVAITHRDSLPVEIDASYVLTWVEISKDPQAYRILPTHVADTMFADDAAAKYAYDLFIKDSRKLMEADTTLREL